MTPEKLKEISDFWMCQSPTNLQALGFWGIGKQHVSDLLTELDAKDAEIAKGEADYLALSEMHNNAGLRMERRISELTDQIAELKRELQRIGKGGSNG